MRRTPIRRRSRKMDRTYVERRQLVGAILAAYPICQRCNFDRSVDVHEIKSRGRGGSILNIANCKALCRTCHDWIGAHLRQALAEGFLLNSWDDEPVSEEVAVAVADIAFAVGDET